MGVIGSRKCWGLGNVRGLEGVRGVGSLGGVRSVRVWVYEGNDNVHQFWISMNCNSPKRVLGFCECHLMYQFSISNNHNSTKGLSG